MNTKEVFKQDKNNFMFGVGIFATIWFLAVCILFGVYIFCSFNSNTIMEQNANDSYNNYQEMSR